MAAALDGLPAAGELPELANVHWRERAGEPSLRRADRAWTLSIVAHEVPLLTTKPQDSTGWVTGTVVISYLPILNLLPALKVLIARTGFLRVGIWVKSGQSALLNMFCLSVFAHSTEP